VSQNGEILIQAQTRDALSLEQLVRIAQASSEVAKLRPADSFQPAASFITTE